MTPKSTPERAGTSLTAMTRFESEAVQLLMSDRWAALATLGDDGPAASMVAYAPVPDLSSLLLFLSGLAEHTRNLLAEPRTALVVSATDRTGGDPQALARVTVKGKARVVERSSPEFEDRWRTYVRRLPDAAPRLALGDFLLFRVDLSEARYVGGFAQAFTIPVERLSAAALESGSP